MDFKAEICQSPPKIIRSITGEYSVVSGATLNTHIDMFPKY